jgi:hypothetical protein
MTSPVLITEPPFQVLPALAGAVGFDEAAVLQVIHYWLDPQVNIYVKEDRHWVPNLYYLLYQKFFFWEAETIEHMIAQFEQSGILRVLQESSEVTYHTINYERLKGDGDVPIPLVPVTPSIHEILPTTRANKNRRPSFKAEAELKGSNIYVMVVEDLEHFLRCDLSLEIQDDKPEGKGLRDSKTQGPLASIKVICHFPRIADKQLSNLVWGDGTLVAILMVLFEMKTMEQLLFFCTTHLASTLVIFPDDHQDDGLRVYRDFIVSQAQTATPKGEEGEIIIPVTPETYNAWVDYMEKVTVEFRKKLWRDQKTNPAIQHYLKCQNSSEV